MGWNVIKTANLARGALSLAIIIVSLVLFKGVANIINAVVIPAALYVNLRGLEAWTIVKIFIGYILMCLVLFNHQIIFALVYCVIATTLLYVSSRGLSVLVKVIVLSLVSFVCFVAGIKLTDMLFMLHIEKMMLQLLNQNYIRYYLIILAEGVIVGLCIVSITNVLEKRLKHYMYR